MDLGIAVVLLSQMSRKADEHYARPTMTHLRDSGAIEAAADQIAVLFTDWAHPLSKRLPEFQGYSGWKLSPIATGRRGDTAGVRRQVPTNGRLDRRRRRAKRQQQAPDVARILRHTHMTTELHALLWSKRGNCFHLEPLSATDKSGRRFFGVQDK